MMYWTPLTASVYVPSARMSGTMTKAMLACPSRRFRLEMRRVRDPSSRSSRNGPIPLPVWATSSPAEGEVQLLPSSTPGREYHWSSGEGPIAYTKSYAQSRPF